MQLLSVPYSPLQTTRALWSLTGANMNSTADQTLVKLFPFTNFTVDKIVVTNASTSLTTAAGGIYTATAKGGSALVSAAQSYAALTGSTKVLNATLQAAASDLLSAANLYLSLTTGQGGAATADIYVMGVGWS